ncbi:MAG: hypothetical protein K9M19_05020 [Candidatus Marinimicrobia bacterium]|nr:hypothetical protein [Candidatus Neomarinimicrobiota bacterium]
MKILKPFALLSFIFLVACSGKPEQRNVQKTPAANLQHALTLIDSVEVNGQMLYYIWIYADAPAYAHTEAPGEGVTCVDDVGRFMEVLEHGILVDHRTNLVPLSKRLVRFLHHMSLPDGRWYNFMWANGEINRERVNSRPEFSWWAVRGLRGLASGYTIYKQLGIEPELLGQIKATIHAMDTHLDTLLSHYGQFKTDFMGKQPAWLLNDGADQTSELLMALTKLQKTGDFDYGDAIAKLGEGLVASQFHSANHPLNGMYFCWNNLWHSWGNNQALALMQAYEITHIQAFRESVSLWAGHFVPFIVKNDFPHQIEMQADSSFQMIPYPQIAYGINSSLRGLLAWNQQFGDESQTVLAEKLFDWFQGGNPAGIRMYDPHSGLCFDGINSADNVNHNSGAESTIECLLSIQAYAFVDLTDN